MLQFTAQDEYAVMFWNKVASDAFSAYSEQRFDLNAPEDVWQVYHDTWKTAEAAFIKVFDRAAHNADVFMDGDYVGPHREAYDDGYQAFYNDLRARKLSPCPYHSPRNEERNAWFLGYETAEADC